MCQSTQKIKESSRLLPLFHHTTKLKVFCYVLELHAEEDSLPLIGKCDLDSMKENLDREIRFANRSFRFSPIV